MAKHVIEFVLEEKFKISRSITVEMNDKEYSDYKEGSNFIDTILKKSNSSEEFISRYKNKKYNRGFKIIKKSNFMKDLKTKEFVCFDLDHTNEREGFSESEYINSDKKSHVRK